MKNRVYIAGPMRGYKDYNFPAFYKAEEALYHMGAEPINPARLDENSGFDPTKDKVTRKMKEQFIRRDVEAVMACDSLVALKGWRKSQGATVEVQLAQWRGIPCYEFPSMEPIGSEDILTEALRLTTGDRQNSYGPPDQDFSRTAKMWEAIRGVPFTARDVAMFMICLKLSRETHQKKRDNWVDIAGYARCGQLCSDAEREAKRKAAKEAV